MTVGRSGWEQQQLYVTRGLWVSVRSRGPGGRFLAERMDGHPQAQASQVHVLGFVMLNTNEREHAFRMTHVR